MFHFFIITLNLNTLNKILSFNKISQYLLLSFVLISTACSSGKKAGKLKADDYRQLIERSELFNSAHTGFQLYDPSNAKVLYSKNADRYFTPASNTKLFTLYTCLQILGDSIPVIRYIEQGDSLIFWGTGDPSLANPYLSENNKLVSFLKNNDKQLF